MVSDRPIGIVLQLLLYSGRHSPGEILLAALVFTRQLDGHAAVRRERLRTTDPLTSRPGFCHYRAMPAEPQHQSPHLLIAALGLMLSALPALGGPTQENLCPNGGFELLLEAAANPLPQNWSPASRGPSGRVEVSSDAAQGKRSLRLVARDSDVAGMNSSPMPVGRGRVQFCYKVLQSAAGGKNLALYAIGLNGAGIEIARKGFSPPQEHVGDGQWHQGSFEFDFSPQQAERCLLAPRINEATAANGDGEWLVDDIQVFRIQPQARLNVAYLWSDKPLTRTGETIRFSAFVENTGEGEARNASVQCRAVEGEIGVGDGQRQIASLSGGSLQRLDWRLKAQEPGAVRIEVTTEFEGAQSEAKTYRVLVIDRRAHYTRQQVCTDEEGYWRLLEKPATLQEQNGSRLRPIRHKRSSEIGHNSYGVAIHLPRAKDYEDPFNPAHLLDDDPETCWSSQQRPSSYPGNPPWVEIDLGRSVSVAQVNLVPYWRNTDFPLGFSVHLSDDGKHWMRVLSVTHHQFDQGGPKRAEARRQNRPMLSAHAGTQSPARPHRLRAPAALERELRRGRPGLQGPAFRHRSSRQPARERRPDNPRRLRPSERVFHRLARYATGHRQSVSEGDGNRR